MIHRNNHTIAVNILIGSSFPKGIRGPCPDHVLILVGGCSWGCEMVGVDIDESAISFNLSYQLLDIFI